MSKYRKQPRPVPNRSFGLWRGCLFAFAAGWSKGFRSDGSLQDPTVEDQRRGRPIWSGSLDADNYTIRDFGRSMDSGGPSLDPVRFDDINDRYDLQGTNRPITAAVLVRPDAVNTDDRIYFSKKAGIDPVNLGWSWGTGFAGSDKWRFEISDGATERFSDTTSSQNTGRSDLLVATYDSVNLNLYVNGSLEASVSGFGTLIGNNNEPVRFFAPSLAGNANGVISMAAIWNRILSPSEIARLNVDPFVMWRTDLHKEFMFGPGSGGSRFQTFFLNFG